MSSHDPNNDAIREGDPVLTSRSDMPSTSRAPNESLREPDIAKARPAFRVLAGFACIVFVALAVLLFPLGLQPQGLGDLRHLVPSIGSVVIAYCNAKFAVTGRGRPWP
jgi:hypothetical protein